MTFRKSTTTLVLLAALVAMVASYALAANQTFTGTVTDDMCGKKHDMMAGHPDAECVRACVRAGSKYALQTADKLYVLKGDTKQIDALAGKKVKVTGAVSGDVVTVSSIAEAK